MTVASGTALRLVELFHHHKLALFMARNHHLGNALAVFDDEILLREVDEQHAHLSAIVGIDGSRRQDIIQIQMKYGYDKQRVITGIKRISKPGLKVYAKKDDVPKVLGGLGIAIISTSNGLLTDKQARELGVGGEVICYVW